MPRRPHDQVAPPREAIWAAIRTHSVSFTVRDLTEVCAANAKTVRDYCKALVAAGYLREQPVPEGAPARWQLVRDVGVEAPRVRPDGSTVTQGSGTEQLWRGMTMLREFSWRDLVETASIGIREETAKAYCQMLLATGYLRVLRKAEPTRGRVARYRLIRNSGPKPPQVQRVKQVYDPNTGEVFAQETRGSGNSHE